MNKLKQFNLFDTKTYLLFVLLPVIFTCTRQDGKETNAFEEHIVKETEVFISTETSEFVGSPSRIKAYNGGLYFSDNGFQRITKVNRDRNRLLSLGSQGRGPGEFESLAGFWVFDDSYLVYDYNRFRFISYDSLGNHIEDKVVKKNPVNPDGFPPNIPITVHAISPHELLIPSRGRNGSLFAIADIESGDMQFAGKAVGEHVESYDQERVEQEFSKGEIPDIFLNLVILGSNSSEIYSFQQTTGMLEKYSHSGDLHWKKNLKIPAQNDMFDQISENNRQTDENTQLFNYARAVDAHEKGVAVLLNMPEGEFVTVAWIPSDGTRLDLVVFPDLDQEKIGFMGSFSVSPPDKRAYFLNSQRGIIFEAEWPL